MRKKTMMGTELTEKEINEFFSRREDIRRLMQGLFAGYEVGTVTRCARTPYDPEDVHVSSLGLRVIDFDRSICEEGKNDVVCINMKEKGETRTDQKREDERRNREDFRNYVYSDRLHTIEIYHVIYEIHYSRYSKKVHKYRTIEKKAAEDHLLEVSVRDRKEIWDKTSGRFDSYGHTRCTYRFWQYDGACTEENEYEGHIVRLLFADEETGKKDPVKHGPVLVFARPAEGTDLTGYMDSPSDYADTNPLFLLFAPFIALDDNGKMPKAGELEKIKSGIFAAFDAFAKDYPDIAYRYIPTGHFWDVYKWSGFQPSPRKGLNRNVFSQKCRLIPTDKGMISLEELFEKTKIDPNPPAYLLKYKDRETLGAALEQFSDSWTSTMYEDVMGKDCSIQDVNNKYRSIVGKILLWDKYKEETKNLYAIGCPLSLIIRRNVGRYLNCKGTEQVLLDEYMNPGRISGMRNYYISIDTDMFCHVRSTFFENADEPAADEFVRAVLEEERIGADKLFENLQGKPWHRSFLNPEKPFSTILDNYIGELSGMSIGKDDNGTIHAEPFMDFDSIDSLMELPQELYDACRDRLGEDDFYDREVIADMTAGDLMETAKYYDYKGEQAVCFWSDDSEGGHLVIFGEKAFYKILEWLLC